MGYTNLKPLLLRIGAPLLATCISFSGMATPAGAQDSKVQVKVPARTIAYVDLIAAGAMQKRYYSYFTAAAEALGWKVILQDGNGDPTKSNTAAVSMLTEVARRHDIDRSLVYRWRRALGVSRTRAATAFLPVEVADGPGAAEDSSLPMLPMMPSAPASGAGRIEIEFADGCRVWVDNQVDGDALTRVLDVLARQQ